MNHMEMYRELQVFTLSLLLYDCHRLLFGLTVLFFCLDNTADERESILLIRRVSRGIL